MKTWKNLNGITKTLAIRMLLGSLPITTLLILFATRFDQWQLTSRVSQGASATTKPAQMSLPVSAQFAISRTLGKADQRYHVRKTAEGLVSHNERAVVSATFTKKGVFIPVGATHWRMALTSVGYGEHRETVATTAPTATENRVEYCRQSITEWYINGPLGLQQGFTLAVAPPQRAGDAPLTLALAPASDVQFIVNADQRSMHITNRAGDSLSYGGLLAFDARGQELPSWIEVQDGQPLLRVNDQAATYPITVDPFVQKAKLTSSQTSLADQLGHAVAISGNTIAVTSPQGVNTAVWIFVKPASGSWVTATETAKLLPSHYPNSGYFGMSLAMDGDTLVVGSPLEDPTGNYREQGAAYVFVKPPGGWTNATTETAKLTASDGEWGDNFGVSVSINQSTIVVGSPFDDIGNQTNQGSAYVFVKPVSGWANLTQTAKLTISNGAAGEQAGGAVAASNDTIVVSSPSYIGAGGVAHGAAYVFVKPVNGWANTTETARLTPSDGWINDGFSHSIAIGSNTIVIGAPYKAGQGSAYVFIKPTAGWTTMTETARLNASDAGASDQFGSSVALSGDTVVVGARLDTVAGHVYRGSAYVFVKPASGWTNATQTQKLTASDGVINGAFGTAVDISNNTIVVGASGQGAAYVFENPPACTNTGYYTVSSVGVNSQPASVVLRDFNEDGRLDLAVANSGSNTVTIRMGDGNGGFAPGSQIGTGQSPISIAAGDLNNDGHLDLAIANQSGNSVSIRLGDGLGSFSGTTTVSVNGQPHAVVLGDVNNDGMLDLATANQSNNSVSIRLGNGNGSFSGTTRVGVGSSPRAVALADFNGDGKLDFAAANQYHNTVSICLGNGLGGFTLLNGVVVGVQPFSVAVGDFNQDGKVDFAAANKGSNSISIRLGNGAGGFTSASDVSVGNAPHSVATGDFDGDGRLDLTTANRNANTVSIRYGLGNGSFAGTTEVNVGIQPYSVTLADINGDGRLDLGVPNLLSNTVSILLHNCF